MANHKKDSCSNVANDFEPVNRSNNQSEADMIKKFLENNEVTVIVSDAELQEKINQQALKISAVKKRRKLLK